MAILPAGNAAIVEMGINIERARRSKASASASAAATTAATLSPALLPHPHTGI